MMILDLHRQGLSVPAIARQTGIDRKTVRRFRDTDLDQLLARPGSAAPTASWSRSRHT